MKREELKKKYPLSKEQYEELKRRYYAGDRVAGLIKDFGLIGIRESQLYLLFDDVITKEKCPHCGSYLKYTPLSRQSTIHDRDLVCISCNHRYPKYHYELCECDGCVKQRKYELWKFFRTEHSIEFGVLEDLPVFERLYLGALHLYGRGEESGYILSFKEQKTGFSFWPQEKTEEIFNSLYNKGYLVVSPKSNIQNFKFNRDNKFDIDAWFQTPPFELWLNENDIFKLGCGEVLTDGDKLDYWKKINCEEARAYLLKIFDNNYIRNYSYKWLNRIVNRYSTAFSLAEIFSAFKYVASFQVYDLHMKKVSKEKVGNNIFRHLENYYDFAQSNLESIKQYGRKFFLADTTFLTRYFYERVLGDKEFFYKKPVCKIEELI